MTWLRHLLSPARQDSVARLEAIRKRFNHFVSLLDRNNRALKVISDMEEKAHGDYVFDNAYLRNSLDAVKGELDGIADDLVALGGERYADVRPRVAAIETEARALLLGTPTTPDERLIVRLGDLGPEPSAAVGAKNAHLGEIHERLGLAVPAGFAITAHAYELFLTHNQLRREIDTRLAKLELRSFDELVGVSQQIQAAVLAAEIPDAIAAAVREGCLEVERALGPSRFAVRSSAVGEDSFWSFAGQYATYLNIAADEVVSTYRKVVASKFTPQALYYLRGHALSDSDPPMAVGCLAMVEARAAGVVYTRNPVDADDLSVLVNAVHGLGGPLVDGRLAPDVFRVDRESLELKESTIARQPFALRLAATGGTEVVQLPDAEQVSPAISQAEATALTKDALRLESFYGGPQDIEWAIDGEGRLFILQVRPMRIVAHASVAAGVVGGTSGAPGASAAATEPGTPVLLTGGQTACPGAGCGPVHYVRGPEELSSVPSGAVVVARNPVPGLVTIMHDVSAIVTCVGGVASHMATLAREARVPTLVGLEVRDLTPGRVVTVDATGHKIYDGELKDLVAARRLAEAEAPDDNPPAKALERLLSKVAPLSLLHPADPGFAIERCVTYHDIIRFAHQKGMEAMFATAGDIDELAAVGVRVKSKIPLQLTVISLDQPELATGDDDPVEMTSIQSPPLASLWSGILREGWPSQRVRTDVKGLAALVATSAAGVETDNFREDSFVVVSQDYMLCSLRMGYHYSTIEAMASTDAGRNYVRMQFKGGGTLAERRLRRIWLLCAILGRLGFECQSRSDFLDARLSYELPAVICDRLHSLGRLTIMTKQLDMALSSDAVAEWYATDFARQLGLGKGAV
jgi:pyruvate,water dikinase